MMGMGEPLLNLDNVIPALRLMLDDHAYGLSRRRVTVSTAGVVPGIDRLRDECPVALAVSLHAPNDALRDQLVPVNRKYPLRELVAACKRYLDKAPRDFITFEYVMLEGVNDSDTHARELVAAGRQGAQQVQPDPVQPVPEFGLQALLARAHPALRRDAAARRPHRDHAQDARRRHRRGLRPACRRRRGPHAPPSCLEGSAAVRRLALLLLLAPAALRPNPDPTHDTGTIIGEVGDPRNRAKLHTELAALYFSAGNMGVALEELRAATAADSSYAPTHGMFGLVYMELRENERAEASFERALRLSPNDADINHNYGWFLCQTGREPASIKYFLQAIRNPLYPTPWRSYSAAGSCTLRAKQVKEAEVFFERALKLDPDEPASLLHLGQIRYQPGQGRRGAQARHALQQDRDAERRVAVACAAHRAQARRAHGRAGLRQPAAPSLSAVAGIPGAPAKASMTEAVITGVGQELAAAREAQGLALSDVAQSLKFAPRQLEALEAEHFAQLPGATFARGMVRSYARLLKLDPEPLLQRIAARIEIPDPDRLAARYHQPVPFSDNARRWTWVYAGVSLGVLALVGAFAYEWHQERTAAATGSKATSVARAAPREVQRRRGGAGADAVGRGCSGSPGKDDRRGKAAGKDHRRAFPARTALSCARTAKRGSRSRTPRTACWSPRSIRRVASAWCAAGRRTAWSSATLPRSTSRTTTSRSTSRRTPGRTSRASRFPKTRWSDEFRGKSPWATCASAAARRSWCSR